MASSKEGQDVFTKGIQKASIWISFLITVAGFISTWAVNAHKIDESEKKLADMEMRVRALEKMNPELLMQQLKSIEQMNNQLDQKISNTNQRVDEVLRILIAK